MGIEEKWAYRFRYLKSDQWQNVRLEALVREKGKCQICGEESLGNDAHHAWYPENIYETKQEQLIILCRSCHAFLHAVDFDSKTSDMTIGKERWMAFLEAVKVWRKAKAAMFYEAECKALLEKSEKAGLPGHLKAKELREAYVKLREENEALRLELQSLNIHHCDPRKQYDFIVTILHGWRDVLTGKNKGLTNQDTVANSDIDTSSAGKFGTHQSEAV